MGNGFDSVAPRRSRLADWKGVGSYGTLGLEMVLSVLFGMFGGRWLDGKLDTAPYLMIAGFGFGVAAAVRALLRAMRDMRRETARDGFRESTTDRPARFALEQRDAESGVLGEPELSQREDEPPSDPDGASPGSRRGGRRGHAG